MSDDTNWMNTISFRDIMSRHICSTRMQISGRISDQKVKPRGCPEMPNVSPDETQMRTYHVRKITPARIRDPGLADISRLDQPWACHGWGCEKNRRSTCIGG
jgi:hypothetical protein